MNILITGATGFVGQSLISHLAADERYQIFGSVRRLDPVSISSVNLIAVGDISSETDWTSALENVDVVIHLAGRAHVLGDVNNVAAFKSVNVEGTLRLAEQAIASGVKRFIFISSIGVNGSQTYSEAFTESSAVAPHAIYAESKRQAEDLLRSKLQNSTMELVIIRPPLVYAVNAPGNFQRLIKLVATGLPLPFGITKNKRSMVSLKNLTDFISLCIEHPAAAQETFLISDGMDLSTKEIVSFLAEGMGKRPKLLPVPDIFAQFALTILRKPSIYVQLYGSLVVDSSKARTLLGWNPVEPASTALKAAGASYRDRRRMLG